MSLCPECTVANCVGQAYAAGRGWHGDLGLSTRDYSDRITEVLEKCLGTKPPEHRAVNLFRHLYTADLYLTIACALPSEAAWARFDHLYRDYLQRVSARVSATTHAASELAEGMPAYLFLPDQAGRSRIAGFDGRSSLASWLSAIINHQATNERHRKCNNTERLDGRPDIADDTVLRRIESELRAARYGSILREAFTTAGLQLSVLERLIMVLRHEEGLHCIEIAQLLHVHPATITRHLQATYQKLREQVLATLSTQHHLNAPAIEECLAEMLAHPDDYVRALFNVPAKGQTEFLQVRAKAMACAAQ